MKLKHKFISTGLAVLMTAMSVSYTTRVSTAKAGEISVYINEVCTQNKSCLADSYGVYSDWIELFNAGSTAVNLSDYGLSDDETNPLQWTFPTGTIIAPGEYMIVFASKQSSTISEMHTGFALSKNGETLVLTSPQGEILQKMIVPTLGEDMTYGRTPDGSSTFEIMTATPGSANETVISAPTFSEKSGFYGTDFELKLSVSDHTEIYYTVDGSDPTNSETAQLYTGTIEVRDRTEQPNIWSVYAEDETSPQSVCLGVGYKQPTFNVDKATVVRAAAKSGDGIFSDVISQTYFVTTGNLAQYQDMMVVSLVTSPDSLFDPETGIYVTGNKYMNWKNSADYDPSKSVWDSSLLTNYYSKGREWEREATVSVFKNSETVAEQDMGIRIKGASTRNAAQKSFNLYARSDYGSSKINYPLIEGNYSLDGTLIEIYDSVCLRSVSDEVRLRDGFSNKLLADRENITTQNMQKCAVFLNGEYWGLYEMTEKFSDDFIESNYGIDKKDVAMLKNGELEKESNLSYHRNLYRNMTLNQIRTYFNQRAEYTIEDMQNYLGLSEAMQTITLKTTGNGKFRSTRSFRMPPMAGMVYILLIVRSH